MTTKTIRVAEQGRWEYVIRELWDGTFEAFRRDWPEDIFEESLGSARSLEQAEEIVFATLEGRAVADVTRVRRMMTVHEAAEFLGVSPSTLYGWVWQRRIAFVKIGRALRFDLADLEKFVDANRIPERS